MQELPVPVPASAQLLWWQAEHPGEGEGHIPCPETWRDKAETLQRNTPPLGLGKHKDLRLPLGATHLGQDQGKEMENVTHAMSLV